MTKILIITILVLIGLLDFGLYVACSHMENREQYQRMKGKSDE